MDKIAELKVEIFDIMTKQGQVQMEAKTEVERLETIKRAKIAELDGLVKTQKNG